MVAKRGMRQCLFQGGMLRRSGGLCRALSSGKKTPPVAPEVPEDAQLRGRTPPLPQPIYPSVLIVPPHYWRWPRRDDDPRMIGDYPATPLESYQLRDPRDPAWDDPQLRRAAGEDVPEDWEALSAWAPDVPPRRWTWPWLVAGPALMVGIVGGLLALGRLVPNPMPTYALRDLPYSHAYYPGGAIPPRKRL